MSKTITQHDIDAEREGQACVKYKKQWGRGFFGVARSKTKYAPADIVSTRKACRNRNSRQVNLQTIRIRERLENPELYKKYKQEKKLMSLKNRKTAKTETVAETVAEIKTVVRTVNGKQVKLTPTENFIRDAAYRLQMLQTQFEQLAKLSGKQYEHTDEMIDLLETQIAGFYDKAFESIKNPVKNKARSDTNPFVKMLKSC